MVNHPTADGNKRLGWLAVVAFYGLNGLVLDAPDDEAYDLVMAMASGHSTTTPPHIDSRSGPEKAFPQRQLADALRGQRLAQRAGYRA